MKLITLIQAGALVMLAVLGAYASGSDAASCGKAGTEIQASCDI